MIIYCTGTFTAYEMGVETTYEYQYPVWIEEGACVSSVNGQWVKS